MNYLIHDYFTGSKNPFGILENGNFTIAKLENYLRCKGIKFKAIKQGACGNSDFCIEPVQLQGENMKINRSGAIYLNVLC